MQRGQAVARPGLSIPTLTLDTLLEGIKCFPGAGDFFEYGGGGCFPDERDGVVIVDGEIIVDGLLQFGGAFEDAAADTPSGDLGEETLDLVSQDAEVGVKWRWNRRCRFSHRLTSGVLWVA